MIVIIVCDGAFLAVIVQTVIVTAATAADIVIAGSVVVDLGVFRDHHVQERAVCWNWLNHFSRIGRFYDSIARGLDIC